MAGSGAVTHLPGDSFTAVRCGWYADVVAGEVTRDVTLVLDGDRIADVLRDGGTPDGRVLDLSEHVVAPGLIDLHTHLTGEEETGSYGDILMESEADAALIGVHNARRTIDAGFTTVRDVGAFRAFTDVSLRKAIDNGWVVGPRMHCAGAYVTTTDGGGEVTGFSADVLRARCPAVRCGRLAARGASRAVRRIMAHGEDLIKVIATGAVLARAPTLGHRSTPRTRSARRSGGCPTTAPSWRRTPTEPRGSSARRAPASGRSSTARSPTTSRWR